MESWFGYPTVILNFQTNKNNSSGFSSSCLDINIVCNLYKWWIKWLWMKLKRRKWLSFRWAIFIHQVLRKTLWYQVLISVATTFTLYMLKYIINTLVSKNEYFISLLIFYEYRNTIIFRVIGTVVYLLFEYYIFLGYLCLNHQKISNLDKLLKNNTYDNFSGIGISDILWTS